MSRDVIFYETEFPYTVSYPLIQDKTEQSSFFYTPLHNESSSSPAIVSVDISILKPAYDVIPTDSVSESEIVLKPPSATNTETAT